MESIGSFLNVKAHQDIYFGGCNSCDGECCNGLQGYALTPLILEDIESVYRNFQILFGKLNGELKLFMVINSGDSHCKYYIDHRCSIYEDRPPACRLYPITPYFEHTLIDSSCPSVNSDSIGERVYQNGSLSPVFQHKRLDGFKSKLEETGEFLSEIKDSELKFEKSVLGVELFRYVGRETNIYLKQHLLSLDFSTIARNDELS